MVIYYHQISFTVHDYMYYAFIGLAVWQVYLYQYHHKHISNMIWPYDGCDILRWLKFFRSLIILWDYCCTYSPSLTKALLYGTWWCMIKGGALWKDLGWLSFSHPHNSWKGNQYESYEQNQSKVLENNLGKIGLKSDIYFITWLEAQISLLLSQK